MSAHEQSRVALDSIPDAHLDEFMGLVGDFVLSHDLSVRVEPSSGPGVPLEGNPDGFNPELVSYLSVDINGERLKVPVTPVHKLSAFAKSNDFEDVSVEGEEGKNFRWAVNRLGYPLYKYSDSGVFLKTIHLEDCVCTGILKAKKIDKVVREVRKEPELFAFSEEEVEFLKFCAQNIKLKK